MTELVKMKSGYVGENISYSTQYYYAFDEDLYVVCYTVMETPYDISPCVVLSRGNFRGDGETSDAKSL